MNNRIFKFFIGNKKYIGLIKVFNHSFLRRVHFLSNQGWMRMFYFMVAICKKYITDFIFHSKLEFLSPYSPDF